MDRFFEPQNVDRYRKLASNTIIASDRLAIMKMLADEEVEFKVSLRKVPVVTRATEILPPIAIC